MTIWVVIVGFSVVSGCTALALESAGAVSTIILERDACYGNCPEYSVRVTKDGVVRFHGKSSVRVLGHRQRRIPNKDFGRLVHAIEAARFDELPNDFPASACEQFLTDHPSLSVTVVRGANQKKKVWYYFGCRGGGTFSEDITRFVALGETMDEILGTARWVSQKPERSRPAQLP